MGSGFILVVALSISTLITMASIGVDLAICLIDKKTFNKYLLWILTSMEVANISLLAIVGLSMAGSGVQIFSSIARGALAFGLAALVIVMPVFYHFVLGIPQGRGRAVFPAMAAVFLLGFLLLLVRGGKSGEPRIFDILNLASYAVPNGVSAYCVILCFRRIEGIRDNYLRRTFRLLNVIQAFYIPISLVEFLTLRTLFSYGLFGVLFNALFIVPTLSKIGRISILGGDDAAAAFAARYGITVRETEIALLLKSGLGSSEIAARLFISNKTLETHITSIYRKTGAKNRVQLLNTLGIGGV